MIKKAVLPLLLILAWLIMNGGITLFNLITGIIVVSISLLATNRLLEYSYINAFSLPVLKFIKYILILLTKIYSSGIYASYIILTGKIKPGFVTCDINPKIRNDYLKNIMATSITLTPGTITVDNDGEKLTVLSLHTDSGNPCSDFEANLIDME